MYIHLGAVLMNRVAYRIFFYWGGGGGGGTVKVYGTVHPSSEFISQVRYEESVWMKVHGGRGREAL